MGRTSEWIINLKDEQEDLFLIMFIPSPRIVRLSKKEIKPSD